MKEGRCGVSQPTKPSYPHQIYDVCDEKSAKMGLEINNYIIPKGTASVKNAGKGKRRVKLRGHVRKKIMLRDARMKNIVTNNARNVSEIQ